MGSRSELQTLLENLDTRIKKVYYQPPDDSKMVFPCVLYEFSAEKPNYANNRKYRNRIAYTVTVVDSSPEPTILVKMGELPLCKHVAHYTKNNKNYDVYQLYF